MPTTAPPTPSPALTQRALPEPSSPATLLLRGLLLLALMGVLVAGVLFGVRQWQAADPYIHAVLALEGDRDQGQAIFQMNCAVCHGLAADGEVGPSLQQVSSRLSQVDLIHQVISGDTPPMPQFQPDPQEMADLLEYLRSL